MNKFNLTSMQKNTNACELFIVNTRVVTLLSLLITKLSTIFPVIDVKIITSIIRIKFSRPIVNPLFYLL
jgi:hypothetical protein